MNEYKIMFSSDITDSVKIMADTFVVTNDTVIFNRLTDTPGCFEQVAMFNLLDIVGFYRSF